MDPFGDSVRRKLSREPEDESKRLQQTLATLDKAFYLVLPLVKEREPFMQEPRTGFVVPRPFPGDPEAHQRIDMSSFDPHSDEKVDAVSRGAAAWWILVWDMVIEKLHQTLRLCLWFVYGVKEAEGFAT
jgi:hypothetical protein